MVLSTRARATALASLVALSSVVNAQGFYYQDPSLQCGPQYNFQYLGCAETSTAPFAFSPNQWDPAITADLSRSSIHYDIGDFVNMTGTPYFCAQFCRSHGFKYTALWDKSCHCGNTLNYKNLDRTVVDLENSINSVSDALCLNGRDGNPYPPCGGDRRENCGSNGGARIFVDPSFPDERALPTLPTLAQGYAQLGCFKKARFPSGIDSITTVNVQSTETCFEYCADLGMPYVYMESTTGAIKCNCGSEFNKNSAQAALDLDKCTIQCSNPTDTAACSGQDCCSTGNGPFPVYANPTLLGCFIPIIPGTENPDTETPASDGYNCFPTPQSILGRAPSPVISYASRTMSASASFIATASPAANAFVNYGCWQSTRVADLFVDVFPYTLTDLELNVDKCVAFCDGANHNFAAVWGTPTTTCACGDTLKTGVTPNGAMEDCNQPCTGSLTQNCGGDNGPLVYAKSNITPNRWADLYTSSWSSTIVYSCTPVGGGGGGGGGPTTATTTSSTTTTTSSTTTTTSSTTTTTSSTTTTTSSTTTTTTTSSTTTSASSTTTTTSSTTTSASSTTTSASGTTTSASSTTTSASSTTTPASSTTTPASSTTTSASGTTTSAGSTTSSTASSSSSSRSTSSRSSTSSTSRSTSSSSSRSGSGTTTPTGGSSTSSSGGASGTGSGSSTPTSGNTGAPTGGQSGSSSGDPGSGSSPTGGNGTATATGGQSGGASGGATGSGSGSVSTSSGAVIPTGGASGTGTGSNNGNGGNGGNGDGAAGTAALPYKDWIFEEGRAPDEVPCYETTMSWAPGEPTFLPDRDEL
ncbi:hypothetical protein F4801DRAFT_285448 [Xylaria longipes]|nr:hypothetical protein F4801DRAFT_285448 [Xylaria longipes]